MKIIVVDDYEQLSKQASQIIAQTVQQKPNATLGLATGSTPLGCYRLLAQRCADGLSFAKVSAVNLDEYAGIGGNHVQSYAYFMRSNLFDKLDINLANTNIPNGLASNLDAECQRYAQLLATLPRDLQLLGLGSNGHIGFNEPGTPFESATHVVNLAQSTIKDNSRLFDDISQVPTQALTMGIAEIMQAKTVLMLASGANKAQAVKAMVEGEITPNCPASVLQRHPNCIVIVDKDAATLLAK